MLTLHLENFRLFSSRHDVPIRPLTILVGENSSGKSSLLAALGAVLDPNHFPFMPDFNRPPFSLGSYDSIATYKGGRFGRAPTFSLGYTLDRPAVGPQAHTMRAEYANRGGQPQLRHLFVKSGAKTAALSLEPATSTTRMGTVSLKIQGRTLNAKYAWPSVPLQSQSIPFPSFMLFQPGATEEDTKAGQELFRALLDVAYPSPPADITPIAPIRSKPERVYDRSRQSYDPTGEHIPYLIDSLLGDEPDSQPAKLLRSALNEFGSASGLFDGIRARRLGSKPGSPFQLMVSFPGPPRNLVDVGYGVSQALPLIVQASLAPAHTLLLFQQPEVHLHPRAQAALGTFFVELASRQRLPVVIETHSDFIIDRVRMAVAQEQLPPESVAIIFCERIGFEGHTYQLQIDPSGNVVNAPPGYRQFFMEEQLDLFRRNSS